MAGGSAVLDRDGLSALIGALRADGYRVIGPTVRDGAIVLDTVLSGQDLPAGWGVAVGPGRYRLVRRGDAAVFAHSTGQQSWKQYLHPPRRPLWRADQDGFTAVEDQPEPMAFLGVRACDLAAIHTLTGVLAGGTHADRGYARRRRGLFVVAVGCTEPGGLCFCASTGSGPGPGPGYDLALTERLDGTEPWYVVRVGTELGRRVLAGLPRREATEAELAEADAAVAAAADRMGRSLPPGDVAGLLRGNRESPVWADVAERCLTCGNCTMVCPTCFCTTSEDRSDLSGSVEHSQRWASCFELDFSYVHGGPVRSSGAGRYRQWISHKLSTWHDQFGMSGCVGCGRCIAWCPVGIDITEELARLADSPGAPARPTAGASLSGGGINGPG